MVSARRPLVFHLSKDEVPSWLRHSHLIRGYRQGGDVASCMWSLFRWHTETLNSWTMVWGVLLSSMALHHCIYKYNPQGIDQLAVWSMFLSIIVHAPFSIGYHQLHPISPEMMTRWRGLDILFIYVASCFLTFTLSHFALPPALALACTGGCVLMTAVAARNAHLLKTGEAGDKLANVKFVSIVVALYYSPIAVVAVQDLAAGSVTVAVECAVWVPFFLVAGGAIYALHVPNRWAPGLFDYIGASQQWMHLCIIAAHLMEWRFVLHQLERHQNGTAAKWMS